jgi:hypothetical protein
MTDADRRVSQVEMGVPRSPPEPQWLDELLDAPSDGRELRAEQSARLDRRFSAALAEQRRGWAQERRWKVALGAGVAVAVALVAVAVVAVAVGDPPAALMTILAKDRSAPVSAQGPMLSPAGVLPALSTPASASPAPSTPPTSTPPRRNLR